MTSKDFICFARTYRIFPQIDIDGDLQEGIAKLFEQVSLKRSDVSFIKTEDKRVLNERFVCSYVGETLMEAITQIENETDIQFSLIDGEDDTLEVFLEYYPRIFSFEEAVRYRCAHSE